MNSQLEEEINFQFSSFLCGPVGIVLVNFRALSTTADDLGEPIFLPEEDICCNGSKAVETGIIAQLKNVFSFPIPFLPLVFVIDNLVDLILHKVVVTVFGYLN